MARLGTAGAETRHIASEIIQRTGTINVVTSQARSGDAAFEFPASAVAHLTPAWTNTANRWFYVRMWFRVAALPASAKAVMRARDGGVIVQTVYLRADGTISRATGSGNPVSAAIGANEWHCLEIGVWGDGVNSRRVKLWLDGVNFDDTTNTGNFVVDSIHIGRPDSDAAIMYADDIAWNDDTGSAQNSRPGILGKVVLLKPVADNAVGADWKLGTGTAPGGAAWNSVNNTPPDGVANGAVGSDPKQIRDIVNNTGSPAADADFTMEAYSDKMPAGAVVRVVNALAELGSSSSSTLPTAALGLVSHPTEGSPAVVTPAAGPAQVFSSGWGLRFGNVLYDPSITLSDQPVVRLGKRTGTTVALLACFVGITVEYEEPQTAELTGGASFSFTASGPISAPVDLGPSTVAVAFTASGSLRRAGRLIGSSAIHFGVTVTPPLAKANLVGSSAVVFRAFGSLVGSTVQLVGSSAVVFSATVAPPTGKARMVGSSAIVFRAFGELTKTVPGRITPTFTERWESGLHVGEAKPGMRVEVRLGRFWRRRAAWSGDDVNADYLGQGSEVWQAFWTPTTPYVEVPNVRDCRLEKSTQGKGIQSATLVIDNIAYKEELAGHHSIKRGYMAPLRGYVGPGRDALVDEQGVEVEENEWFEMFSRQAQVTIYQSYGDQEVEVFTGLTDDVDTTSRPDVMTVVCRDFGQVLDEERLFGWNKEPDIKEVTFIDRDQADDITLVGDEASSSGDYSGSHAAPLVTDGDSDTSWWSPEHTTAGNTEWVQIRLRQGRYSDFKLWCDIEGLDAYVSLYAHNLENGDPPTLDGVEVAPGWQGAGLVPGTNGDIPYLTNPTDLSNDSHIQDFGSDREFRVGPDSILRVSFRNLQYSPAIDGRRAGVRTLMARRRKLDPAARTEKWVRVDDVSDVVKQILRWAGFKEWDVETTGVKLSKRIVTKGMTYREVIDKAAEAVGYVFYMADPTPDPDSIGVPVFRKSRVLMEGQTPVLTVRDNQLLTAVEVKESDEPLAYIIRVRGRESSDGQTIGGGSEKRIMVTYRPPWSYQLDTNEMDDMAGVIRHVVHTNNLFRSVDDCKFGAFMIALEEALGAITGSAGFPAHPGVDLDDMIELYDLGTGLTTRLLLTSRSSTFTRTKDETQWTMQVAGALVDTKDIQDVVADINEALRD